MNPIEHLEKQLKKEFPHAIVEISKPLLEEGFWLLDVRIDNYMLVVEWSKKHDPKIGLTADPEHGYGEGVDEIHDDLESALPRIIHLISNKENTSEG